MTLTIYSNPSSKATARPQRLFKTRHANRAWTMAVRAIRVVIASGRECAPWQAPSSEQVAEIVLDHIDVSTRKAGWCWRRCSTSWSAPRPANRTLLPLVLLFASGGTF